ncbi:hypothetical protein AACH06_22040 [Ideonella sp. DXS29W]|uniref:Uncharacterized protein n=1 Tax=Ideonella lacteola TaxID=2984193 RepID=A0ABU9BUL9_9BURK
MNMTTTATDPARADRLYALLPVVHRMRDAERGYPLKALLRVIAEQVQVVEDDITQLYDNWFIETAQEWAVPYIGDLVGHVPLAEGGLPADTPACDNARVLVPRREVANAIRHRRAKGTLALLEQLAQDVAGWPARAVEYFKLLGRHQNINHLYPERHRVVNLRDMDALDRLGGPFDSIAHGVDLRRIDSHRSTGLFNIPNVGVHVWRLLSLPVTDTPACCVEEVGPHCFTFSVLGQDAPLFVAPQPEPEPTHIADELNLPAAIRRHAFNADPGAFYGEGMSLAIRAEGWAGSAGSAWVPLAQIVPADLSHWAYVPRLNQVAVDPVLGRIAFPPNQLPRKGVRVSYRYGLPARLGGGEYERPLHQPASAHALYRVGEGDGYLFHRIGDALAQWRQDDPDDAVIEIGHSGVFVEPIDITLRDGQSLQLRAAQRARPVLRLIDWQTDLPDALTVSMGQGSRISLDGLLVTGRPLRVQGRADADTRADVCGARVVIRHCTLVPGWALEGDCHPRRPAEPSLEISNLRASVKIEHSIVGTLRVMQDEVGLDPMPIEICDSVVDATARDRQAIGGAGDGIAPAQLTLSDTTVLGIVDVHAIALAENCIFTGCVNVARRQIGCLRFCYVPCGCRTPRRYRCQPDEVLAAVRSRITDADRLYDEILSEQLRLRPQFTAERYGQPGYAQLATTCAPEITRGADDDSEMGVYHDLFQPQRAANLRARLNEFTPAGMHVGLLFAN